MTFLSLGLRIVLLCAPKILSKQQLIYRKKHNAILELPLNVVLFLSQMFLIFYLDPGIEGLTVIVVLT